MGYEKKALDALDKILDALIYEEGRLAIINKYGPILSDEEKAQATGLITKQRADLDRLFSIAKQELTPLMDSICQTGEAMSVFVDKLVTGEMIAKQMMFQQEVTAMKDENNAMAGTPTGVTTDAEKSEVTEVTAEAVGGGNTGPGDVVATDTALITGGGDNSTSDGQEITSENGATEITEGGAMIATEGEGVSGMTTEGERVMTEATGDAVSADTTVTGNGAAIEAGSGATDEGATIETGSAEVSEGTPTGGEGGTVTDVPVEEEATVPFVLSPITEGVAPAPTKEEEKAAEEGIAAADQQLQAIDTMKNDIISDSTLTEDEKAEKLEQYTRITDGAVRAILVTKAQYERLLASRSAQKELLSGKKVETNEATPDVVAALPDFTAMEGAASTGGDTPAEVAVTETAAPETGEVVLPMINGGEVSGSEQPAEAAAVADTPAAAGGFLPLIESAPVENNANANGEQAGTDTTEQVVLPTIVPGGDAPAAEAAPVETTAGSQNELQLMIEQANGLYKEGKVAEAQALFEKIGAMNKGAQADASATDAQAEAGAVLVKK